MVTFSSLLLTGLDQNGICKKDLWGFLLEDINCLSVSIHS